MTIIVFTSDVIQIVPEEQRLWQEVVRLYRQRQCYKVVRCQATTKERLKSLFVKQRKKLKFERCFLCRSIICPKCHKCPHCCSKSSCRGQTEPALENLAALGASPNAIRVLKEAYSIPFWNRPILTRSSVIISGYVNPLGNSYLLEALHALIQKNSVEKVTNQRSLAFFSRLFLVPKLDLMPSHW